MVSVEAPQLAVRATLSDRDRARAARYALRRIGWRVNLSRTLRGCGRATREDTVGIHAVPDGNGGHRGAATGLVTCSSVWSCPVCAAHIRQVRANDIEEAVRVHLAGGGQVVMLTLTLRHKRGHKLATLLDALYDGWRRTIRGAPWQRRKDRHGIVGTIRAAEVTYGRNGWHPHLHVLLFLDKPTTATERIELEDWLHARWTRFVGAHHRSLRPSRAAGVRLQVVNNAELGQYLAKVQDTYGNARSVGLEIARGDLKSGRDLGSRLPFDLLESAGDGEAQAVKLWHEYVQATAGRRCIEWSRGLRDHLGMGDELADEDIVEETDATEDTLVAEVSARDWVSVCARGQDYNVLRAALDGPEAVEEVVRIAVSAHRLRTLRTRPDG